MSQRPSLLTLILDKSFPPSEPFATLDCHIAACVGKTLQASHLEDGCSFTRDNRTRCGNKISVKRNLSGGSGDYPRPAGAASEEDLSREYQAIIAYVVYSQVLKGAEYMNIAYMNIADQLEAARPSGAAACPDHLAADRRPRQDADRDSEASEGFGEAERHAEVRFG